ncbi:NAD(P)H-hydrate dehydratase [Myxococcota bacterium]|nr:NAD(P)H-hydrate dehydratase [Myxococcota bacterium]
MRAPIASASQVRAFDAYTIQTLGVPSVALMETAGRAVVDVARARFGARLGQGVWVVCGRGNNGGDGYVIARTLRALGVPVSVWAMGGAHSPDGGVMRLAAEAVGVPVVESEAPPWARPPGLVVDALLGSGVDRPLEGVARARVEAMNAAGCPVLAVDLPSGLCGDTGRVWGVAARAAITVTFGWEKLGLVLEPGADYAGEVIVADIGLVAGPDAPAWPLTRLNRADVARRLPARAAASHKVSHGHLAVVAGSVERAGAAVLVCAAAIRSGCGLVTLFAAPEALPRLGALPPEVMLRLDPPTPSALQSFSAAAVGPGVGVHDAAAEGLNTLWAGLTIPAVFDADGLTALARAPAPSPHPRAITPHPGEAGRLLGRSSAEVQADRLGAVQALAALAPALLKGRHTLISGAPPSLNPTGHPGLAVAGSGDVLTGLVGGLLAQGLGAEDALCVGAYAHGLAADLLGAGPFTASELALALPKALQTLKEGAC